MMIIMDPKQLDRVASRMKAVKELLNAPDCEVMGNVIAIQSSRDAEEAFKTIVAADIFSKDESFLIVPIRAGWLGQNCRRPDDCSG
jgi:hypothetical protein